MTVIDKVIHKFFKYLKCLNAFDAYVEDYCAYYNISSRYFLKVFKNRTMIFIKDKSTESAAFVPTKLLQSTVISFTWERTKHGHDYWKNVSDNMGFIMDLRKKADAMLYTGPDPVFPPIC